MNYFAQPLTTESLQRLLRSAGLKPLEAIRTKEDAYRKHIAGKKLGDRELIRLMVRYPELIQRPLVVRGGKTVLARPVERLSDLGI